MFLIQFFKTYVWYFAVLTLVYMNVIQLLYIPAGIPGAVKDEKQLHPLKTFFES